MYQRFRGRLKALASGYLRSFWQPRSPTPWVAVGAIATVCGMICFGIGAGKPAGNSCAFPPLTQVGEIEAISADTRTVVLEVPPDGLVKTFSSGSLGNALSNLGLGDSICFSASTNAQKAQQLDAIAVERVIVGRPRAVGALLLAFATIWCILLIITNGHPWSFVLGLDGRLSNSQTQIYLWFLVLATVYLSELGLRLLYTGVLGGITAPTNLLLLAGVSAFTFGTARLSTMTKTGDGSTARLAGAKRLLTGEPSRRDLLRHLFTNDDGLPDLADMQMVVLSAITGAIYLGISAEFLAGVSLSGHINLPPVEDTLLGGTALSQGAYLFKKLGSRPGLG